MLDKRDKSILIGLYFSMFDQEGLTALGFGKFREAFNTIGYAIGAEPLSLRNYRDEFDPFFPNPRKGWHARPLREHCKKILEEYSSLSLDDFTNLIKDFLYEGREWEMVSDEVRLGDLPSAVEKRIITGIAAEEYFRINYSSIDIFKGHTITDTTKKACGFDFKLDALTGFYCVEVKGLNSKKGSVSLTEKEFGVARSLKEKYCLFVVSNFVDAPVHSMYFDPLNSHLSFDKVERQIIQISYQTQI